MNIVKDTQPEIKERRYGGDSDAKMYHSEGKVRFYKPVADTIFSIDASMNVKPEFIFEYGKYKRPVDQKKLVPADIQPNYVVLSSLLESKQFLFMQFPFGALAPEPFEETITLHGATKQIINRHVMVIFDKYSGEIHLMKQPQKGDIGFLNDMETGAPAFWPTFISRDGTEMVMLYEADKFIENYSKVKNPSKKLKELLRTLKFDANPVAIIAKLK